MITRVDSVIIADKIVAPASIEAMNVGEAALFNENRTPIKSNAEAIDAKMLYIGVCTGTVSVSLKDGSVKNQKVIKYSNAIQKASKPRFTYSKFEAPVEDKIVIDFTDAEIVAGYRYAIRIAYKDIYEHPGQFTHTYDAIATSADTAELAAKLQKQINKHPNRRVTTSLAGAVLTLTAMPKDDNEGVNSINEYSVVSMVGTVYQSDPHSLIGAMLEAVPGIDIQMVQGNPGVGYWKQVRDLEARALGYEGKVYTDAYPVMEPQRFVKEGTEYDSLIVENDNLYLTPDNQYIKTTPLRDEVFVAKGEIDGSILISALENFGAVPTNYSDEVTNSGNQGGGGIEGI